MTLSADLAKQHLVKIVLEEGKCPNVALEVVCSAPDEADCKDEYGNCALVDTAEEIGAEMLQNTERRELATLQVDSVKGDLEEPWLVL